MRIAFIAPEHDRPIYQRVTCWARASLEISHFITDLTSPEGFEQLLAEASGFDAVVMLAPNAVTAGQMEKLAELKKHLLVDPCNTTLQILKRSTAMWASAGALFMAAQPQRFTHYGQAIAQSLRAGELGTAGLLRIHHWRDADGNELSQVPLSQVPLSQVPLSQVPRDRWQTLLGEIDLACWFFQGVPGRVFARQIAADGRPRGVLVHLAFGNGMALIDVVQHPGPTYYSVSLIGSQGAVYADDHHNTNLLFQGKTQGRTVSQDPYSPDVWLRPQLEAFVNAIGDGQPDATIDSIQLAQQVTSIVERSVESGRVAQRTRDGYELQ